MALNDNERFLRISVSYTMSDTIQKVYIIIFSVGPDN